MIIPLNIVMTYPVRWGKYEVFRDFIQNFYDSVNCRDWHILFKHSFQNQKLTMWIDDVCFSYEWLLHIGASTKTERSSDNAGYFGEGFKIASLCALRDYNWNVRMSSGAWNLSVVCIDQKIDKTNVKMLAYDVEDCTKVNQSRLTLFPISPEEYILFEMTINSFYFPQNPLMGEKLWEGREGAVYLRSKDNYDRYLPYTNDFGRKGAVFCAYQLLGSNPFNLVVCQHCFRKEDRERRSLYSFQVVDVFQTISYYIDANGAMYMLEMMRRYWNSTPKKRIDIHSWAPVISNLIERIRSSPRTTALFVEKHPNLLCLDRIYTIRERNRRGQARAWLDNQSEHYLLVQSRFKSLGYETLEEKCEEQGGFVVDDKPNELENNCFSLLELITTTIYNGFFAFGKEKPERRVIRNPSASYHGMVKVFKHNSPRENDYGLQIRYDIGEIYLKENIFSATSFHDAVATYIHESCHMFGGDSSKAFSLSLTYAMEIMLAQADKINAFEKKWKEVFAVVPESISENTVT